MEDLIQHIHKFIVLRPEEARKLAPFFNVQHVKKKQILLGEGERCRYNFFVKKGCLRMFFITEKGVEQTVQFAIEGWWLSDYLAFEKREASAFTIQAVEPAEVFAIDYTSQEALLKEVPSMERYFRLLYQRAYAASQNRIKYLTDYSKEEAYVKFHNSFPEFTRRIPQQMLASYLQMTPEYLSEIKRKLNQATSQA
ncbi:CRP-like cAMP-binding protein [Sphingobacterium allocomposti]|jgi:CRP-like cAMP-binding protein|uniref:CRP-like cAMP-binding protein n=1 Tax=Sphingobacterium allocomposti TaxID=415956 RepID=A0A5S5DLY8_9SPHI|nr:Crp/Fnr family transcriptional regulator [Sphingobacterium composti Yoo et al. 2007 non Ten et al. 2007]TYP96950.1 CRP-like cAMP-binding protein [Sphingobacterium composti Yoo et al. 2007 non Ten et al. 2007]HLS94246.1 Crp/Fnr family transcriptional regulator [Sphingobacterium sp.]